MKKKIIFLIVVILFFVIGGMIVGARQAVWNFTQEYNPFRAEVVTLIEEKLKEDGTPEALEAEIRQEIEQEIRKEIEEDIRQEIRQEIKQEMQKKEIEAELKTEEELNRKQKLAEIKKTLDSMVKEVDILSKQVDEIVAQKLTREPQDGDEKKEENIDLYKDKKKEIEEQKSGSFLANILISEVVTGLKGAKNEFIELYNPNNFDVILSNDSFKLKLVNSNNEITVKRITELPKIISAHSYFLLVGGETEGVIADATFSAQLTSISGVIITDSDDNIKDRISWGRLDKQPPLEAVEGQGAVLDGGLKTGQSIGRIWTTTTDSYIYTDTNNNATDFEIQTPTPGERNQPFLPEDDKEIKDKEEEKTEELLEIKEDTKEIFHNPCADGGKVDINIALLEDLDFLTGIGKVRAQNIIDERGKRLFNLLDDLVRVKGIGPKTLQNIKDQGCAFIKQKIIRRSGGGRSTILPLESPKEEIASALKVLISEVQIDSIDGTGGAKDDFIELYNPNNVSVNLKGYHLVKRTKDGIRDTSIKSWTLDTFIDAGGYYLWANSDYQDITIFPNSTTSATIASNNGIAIRFGSKDTGLIIDSLAWGNAENIFIENSVFPENPVGQSIGRIWTTTTDIYIYTDTNNNATDFEIQTPTLRAKNQKLLVQLEENKQNLPVDPIDLPATDSPEDSPETPSLVVVINEVAWMGGLPQSGETTRQAANNEWIELKNISGSEFDLTGWTLKAKDGTPEINLSETISTNGFYLLERTNNTATDQPADWYGSFGHGLSNGGEKLELRDSAENLIDVVDFSTGWQFGDNDSKKTMERTPDLNWQTSASPGGTPKAKNSTSY